jgi:hypothetical protein
MSTSASELLAAVERSPRAAAAHDRTGWVELFTADGRVEDPVGSRPHVGREQIGRFYDTFIGPRDIVFHRDLDVAAGSVVLRDLELAVAMSSAVTMRIPAYLRYDLRAVDGEWKIAVLRAYWELPSMVGQFLRNGPPAVPAGLQLARGLLRNQGLRGTLGFAAGFRRVSTRHKHLVATFLAAVARGDKRAALRLLSSSAAITVGDDATVDGTALLERLGGAAATRPIGAGSTVVVSISSPSGRGVLCADVARRGDEIRRVCYFPA